MTIPTSVMSLGLRQSVSFNCNGRIYLHHLTATRSQLKVKKFRSSTHFYSTSNNATPPPPGVGKTSPTTEKGGATSDDSSAKKIDETTSKILANFQPSQWNVAGVRSAYDNLSQKVLAIYQDKMTQAKDNVDKEWYSARVSFWMKRYENFVGLTDVKEAQVRVVQTEKQFINSQENRRATQKAINDIQQTLKSLYDELERTNRGQNKYLELVTKEHHVLQEQSVLTEKLNVAEREEREAFSKLSRAVRDSHESERAQAEKTKYWSVIGSIIGTCLGILGTTINNRLRMRELRQLVKDAAAINSAAAAAAASAEAVTNTAAAAAPAEESTALAGMMESLKNLAEVEASTCESIDKVSKTLDDIKLSVSSLEQDKQVTSTTTAASVPPSFVKHQNEELRRILTIQQEKLEKLVRDMKFQLDSKDIRELQSQVKLIAMKEIGSEEVTSRAYETLNRNATTALESFEKRVLDIEEMVKDVRSLLLAQALAVQSSSSPTHKAPATAKETGSAATAEALERSHLTIVGTVETALRDHEERLNSAMILNSVFVALLTPVIAYAVSKCL